MYLMPVQENQKEVEYFEAKSRQRAVVRIKKNVIVINGEGDGSSGESVTKLVCQQAE